MGEPGPPGRYRCCRGNQGPVVRLPGVFGFGPLSLETFLSARTFLIRRGIFCGVLLVSLFGQTNKRVGSSSALWFLFFSPQEVPIAPLISRCIAGRPE